MTDTIVVAGATGAVGRHVAALLANRGKPVIAMSRHAEAARDVANPLSGAVGRAGRWTDSSGVEDIEPGTVVNCTGIEDTRAVQAWRDAGWAVIDITASSPYALELAGAPTDGPPLVVGVGLIPGLTSVLARDLIANAPDSTSITISCLVGLGEEYGDASRDWTYSQLGRTITTRRDTFRNFSQSDTIDFPAGFGARPAWRFDFADRALLPDHLGVEVTTRYCFDSRIAGRALALASAVPTAARLLQRVNKASRRTVAGGTAWWAGVIETDTGRRTTAIGRGQSQGTAAIAAVAAERLTQAHAPAARHLWDLVTAAELVQDVASLGILVHTNT